MSALFWIWLGGVIYQIPRAATLSALEDSRDRLSLSVVATITFMVMWPLVVLPEEIATYRRYLQEKRP